MAVNTNGMSPQELAEFKLTKSKVKVLMQVPFFGQLLCNLNVRECKDFGTMATNGKELLYDVDFVCSLEQKELNFVNAHEVLHVALGHVWRRGTRACQLWNIACDYAVNGIIIETMEIDSSARGIFQKPNGVLYKEEFNGMSAEEIYNKLYNNTTQQDIDNMIQKLLDSHDIWDEKETQEGKEDKIKEWEGKLVQASSTAKGSGKLAAGLERILDSLTKPTKNWREEISDFCQPEVNDYSFCPPDRRYTDFDFFLPDFNEPIDVAKDVLVIMDTSASISQKEETAFYSETYGAIQQFGDKLTGWVMFFDGTPYDPIPFDSAEEMIKIAPKGGGGTNFQAVFDKIRELTDKDTYHFSGIMFCTDGGDDFPSENPVPDIPLLWVMTTDIKPPFGRCTRLQVDEY